MPPLTPTLVFFPLRTRGAIFLRRVTSLQYLAKPGGRASEDKTGTVIKGGGEVRSALKSLRFAAEGLSTGGFHPGSSGGLAALFVGKT